MRRSYNDVGFIMKDGELKGVSLGFDFCSEHEWGIDKIKKAFGVDLDKDKLGIDAARITQIPVYQQDRFSSPVFGMYGENHRNIMIFSTVYADQTEYDLADQISRSIDIRDKKLCCAWDEGSFAILAKDKEHSDMLTEIFEAFRKQDIVFGMKPSAWIEEGLCFLIESRLPEDFKKKVLNDHLGKIKMDKLVEDSGIKQLLAEKGKRYHALTKPHFNSDEEIVMWLNPMDQDRNNFGWFTIDELRQWAENKGPIPKNKE